MTVYTNTPTSTLGTVASTPITITPNALTAVGDQLFVLVASSDDAAPTYTLPGWTVHVNGVQTGTLRTWLFSKTRLVSETSYTMTRVNATDTATVCVTVSGCDPDGSIVVGTVGTRAGSGGSNVTTAPSINATVPSMSLVFGSERTAANETVPTVANNGFSTVVWAAPSYQSVFVAQKEVESGAVGATSITYQNAHGSNAAAVQLAIPLGVEGPPPGWPAYDGEGEPVEVYYKTSDGVAVPQDLVLMRRGFKNVAEMLATPGATWAHRGGSVPWPEMSLHAYTQAVARGYGALEMSLQRTADGVWFGCHDVTIARVTGNGGLTTDVRTMTWSQINAYQIAIGASGAPQPFMRWEDMLDSYADSHVLILDPKNSVFDHQSEFITMVAGDVGTDRVVMKWSGGMTPFADAAGAAGFETWGYYYQDEYTSGMLADTADHWTILGMDLGANAPAWEAVTSYNKPVTGHIASTQADYNTAIAKGADMVQCAGVHLITPVSNWA